MQSVKCILIGLMHPLSWEELTQMKTWQMCACVHVGIKLHDQQ